MSTNQKSILLLLVASYSFTFTFATFPDLLNPLSIFQVGGLRQFLNPFPPNYKRPDQNRFEEGKGPPRQKPSHRPELGMDDNDDDFPYPDTHNDDRPCTGHERSNGNRHGFHRHSRSHPQPNHRRGPQNRGEGGRGGGSDKGGRDGGGGRPPPKEKGKEPQNPGFFGEMHTDFHQEVMNMMKDFNQGPIWPPEGTNDKSPEKNKNPGDKKEHRSATEREKVREQEQLRTKPVILKVLKSPPMLPKFLRNARERLRFPIPGIRPSASDLPGDSVEERENVPSWEREIDELEQENDRKRYVERRRQRNREGRRIDMN